MQSLLKDIKQCTACAAHLPHGVNPVVAASVHSSIVMVGQAPGRIVHQTGIPWNDKSGDNLRAWMGVDKDVFYDAGKIALVPMGFCYPGKGASGDLPPRAECAPLWHKKLLAMMPSVKLTILVGQYAQQYYLRDAAKDTLTETVRHATEYLPCCLPLPHPSPRNNIWMKKNPWFAAEVLPLLKQQVYSILQAG